jgi:hypothetical protein
MYLITEQGSFFQIYRHCKLELNLGFYLFYFKIKNALFELDKLLIPLMILWFYDDDGEKVKYLPVLPNYHPIYRFIQLDFKSNDDYDQSKIREHLPICETIDFSFIQKQKLLVMAKMR